MKIAIYTRVSKSDGSQDVERQLNELENFASSQNWTVVEHVSEKMSGQQIKRNGTERLIRLARGNQIQKVLIWEISRLGRNLADVVNTVEALCQEKVSVFDFCQRQETLDHHYQKTIFALIVLPLLSGIAEQWSLQHSLRIKSGLAKAARNGKRLGRPKAQKLKCEDAIVQLLQESLSIRKTAKEAGVSDRTVKMVKKKRSQDLRQIVLV